MQYFNITEGHDGDDCCYNHPFKALCLKMITKFSMIKELLLFKIGGSIPSKQVSFIR